MAFKRTISVNPEIIKLLFLFLFLIYSKGYAQLSPAEADTTFVLGKFNGVVKKNILQPDGKILVVGDFTFHKTKPVGRVARLNSDGSLDINFICSVGANAIINDIALQSDGKIIIAGNFTQFNGAAANGILRLNSDGSIDASFITGLGFNGELKTVKIQTNGQIIVGGFFTSYNGTPVFNIARLNTDGNIDTGFDTGTSTNSGVLTICIQSDGKILIGGSFTTFNSISSNFIARLNADGSKDASFSVGTGTDMSVYTFCMQGDGKILMGGTFNTYNGIPAKKIVRLNSDGSIDNSFITGSGIVGYIIDIAVQSDAKIILGGAFSLYNGINAQNLIRLNADGSIDSGFAPSNMNSNYSYSLIIQPDSKILVGGGFGATNYITRFNEDGSRDAAFNLGNAGLLGEILCIALQTDGKIIIGGQFTEYNKTICSSIARINPDGSFDNSFNTGTGLSGYLNSLAIQPDGKIIIAGLFNAYNGTAIRNIARINTDGSLDSSFNPGASTTGSAGTIYSIALQLDGKIIIGGLFTAFNGSNANGIARLNSDGSLDTEFNVGAGVNGIIFSIVLQADGNSIIAGDFTMYNSIGRKHIARLSSNGSLDLTFDPGIGTNSGISTLALQPDGKILIGGGFTMTGMLTRVNIARLNFNGSLDLTFNPGNLLGAGVTDICVLPDAKLMVVGYFLSTAQQIASGLPFANRITRLNPNGSYDNSFTPTTGCNAGIATIALQSNGQVIFGGVFTRYNEMPFGGIARLKGDPNYLNTIHGKVYTDSNKDCLPQKTETRLSSVIIKAVPGPYFGGTDAFGNYQVRIDSGAATYTITQEPNELKSKLYINQCALSYQVPLSGASKHVGNFNFADSIRQCALLKIEIENTRMRRCFRNYTYVNYCNYGSKASNSAQVKVELPPYVYAISSAPAWTAKIGSTLIYDVGIINAAQCGTITIVDSIICGDESIRGLTQCIKASISPASTCDVISSSWDKSSIKVNGNCVQDSVAFIIRNNGTGNMTSSRNYRLYINDTLIYTGTFILNAGEQLVVKCASEGNTIRIEADQHPLHPGRSRPRATVENCGNANPGANARNFVTSAPLDDLDEEVSSVCGIIRDSYDPNEKLVIPSGIGTNKLIVPGQELTYSIHFQNTGSDVAYNVKIIDTLDTALDAASFSENGSSHPYTLSISGKGKPVLTYTFTDINLPDITTDNLGSNGVFSFKIKVPDNAALGTLIHNKAYIYFDYNSAIITNETVQTIGTTDFQDLSKGTKVSEGLVTSIQKTNNNSFKVYPNPTAGMLTIETPLPSKSMEVRILNLLGTIVKTMKISNSTLNQISLEGLNPGMYLIELRQDGESKSTELVQVK